MRYKTSKSDFKIFTLECKKWIDRFGLKEWDFIFEHKKLKDAKAACMPDTINKIAKIILSTNWYPEEVCIKQLLNSAMHEVLHILMAKYEALAKSRYTTENLLDDEQEDIVRRIVSAIKGGSV